MDNNDRAAIEALTRQGFTSNDATAALAALRAAGWSVMPPLSSLELTDNLDLIEGLIIDVENKWSDPHTLQHAKQALADVRAVLLPPPPPEPRDE